MVETEQESPEAARRTGREAHSRAAGSGREGGHGIAQGAPAVVSGGRAGGASCFAGSDRGWPEDIWLRPSDGVFSGESGGRAQPLHRKPVRHGTLLSQGTGAFATTRGHGRPETG